MELSISRGKAGLKIGENLLTYLQITMASALVFVILLGFFMSVFFYFLAKEKQRAGQAEGKLEHAQNEVNFLRQEKEKFSEKSAEKISFLQERVLSFEKQNELLKQAQHQFEKEKQEWRKDKETILFQLSEELIKKNNEQQNQVSLNQREEIKKITENLFKNFENVTSKVASLNDDVQKSADLINLTKQALLNPGAAGRTAEITLENILKKSGLREKQSLSATGDYILQTHFSGMAAGFVREGKRPDAILFLPNDQILIIDSKSSPLFLDLEMARQNSDFEQEKVLRSKIKESFKKHRESLKKKEYVQFLLDELQSKNSVESQNYQISLIMFLQTEKMMEIVRELDAEFEHKALEDGVIIATPIGLINLLSQASLVIARLKQEKNLADLKIAFTKLLDSVALVFKDSKDLGTSLNKALVAHSKLAKNLNSRVYSAMNKISELGISSKKSAEVQLLEEYEENEEV